MKGSDVEATSAHTEPDGDEKPALQVVCLGNGGGPSEENVTGFLVRSIASDWARGSLLAVDAGSHLAPIIRILERDFPSVSGSAKSGGNGRGSQGRLSSRGTARTPSPGAADEDVQRPEPTTLGTGPFAGLRFPNLSARANALHVIRNFVSTYLITHPHLDHLSGFAVNTAAFHATSRPKTLAALPSTVDAVKQHIFNDIIWPNLTDEDGGVGFVTFQRLKEGGDVMVGSGEGRGYIDVSDRLGVKAFKVSHGVCTKSPPSHQHRGSIHALSENAPAYNGPAYTEATQPMTRQHSQFSAPGTPGIAPRSSFYSSNQPSPRMGPSDPCVVDSSAFFIREEETQREILIFGDVEADSISLSPRNYVVWQEAARKIAHGSLGGIFIECSYEDSQADAVLFGHLKPKHLIAELQTLASLVTEARTNGKKRKRSGPNGTEALIRHVTAETQHDRKRSRGFGSPSLNKDARRSSLSEYQLAPDASAPTSPHSATGHPHTDSTPAEPPSPKTTRATAAPSSDSHTSSTAHLPSTDSSPPLAGIKVIIIHVKDTLQDGPHVSETILAQLNEYERRLVEDGNGLGCEFVISRSGESYWF